MKTWFLKKSDGRVYGPVALADLAAWATEGRVVPEDMVSQDRKSWQNATAMPELGMEWTISIPGDGKVGPVNALALCDLLVEGTIEVTMPVVSSKTGKSERLGSVLMNALIKERKGIQDRAAAREKDLRAKIEDLTASEATLKMQLQEEKSRKAPAEPAKESISDTQAGDKLASQAQAAEEEARKLAAQLADAKAAAAGEKTALQKQIDDLQKQAAALQKKADGLEKDLEERVGEVDRLQARITELADFKAAPVAKAKKTEAPAKGQEHSETVVRAAAAQLKAAASAKKRMAKGAAARGKDKRSARGRLGAVGVNRSSIGRS